MKKLVIFLTIGGTIAAYLFSQAEKFKKSKFTFNGIQRLKVGGGKIAFELYLNFLNLSDIPAKVYYQEYSLFVNGLFISRASNFNPVTVRPNKIAVIPLQINISLDKLKSLLKTSLIDLLTNPEKIKINIIVNSKIKLLGFTFNIPFAYSTTLAELQNNKITLSP